jgi:hypothetical protein
MTSSLTGKTKPEVVICTYRIKKGHDAAFLKILGRHWPTLKRQGLVSGKPALIYRGKDESRKSFYVEIFTWKAGAAELAHGDPAVMEVWGSMGKHMESRLRRPEMEHPHVMPVKVRFAKV